MDRYLYLSLIEAVIVSSVFSSLFFFIRYVNPNTFIVFLIFSLFTLFLHFLYSFKIFRKTKTYPKRYLFVGIQGMLESILIGLVLQRQEE